MAKVKPVIDVTVEERAIIRRLLERHLPGTAAWVYGSRARWTSSPTSDLDLVVFATPDQRMSIIELRDAFEESDLPFCVDLFVWDDLSEKFKRQIEAEYVVVADPERRSPPIGWRVLLLQNCVTVNEATYSLKRPWPFINYLNTGSIKEGRISGIQRLMVGEDSIPSRAKRIAKQGDIVYSTVRPNQKHFGLLRDVPENFLVSTGFAVIMGKPDVASTAFVYWFLTQKTIVSHLQAIAEQSTSAYPSIKPEDIERLTIALPPLAEQRAIAHVLSTLDDKIDLNRRMNETLEAMARALFKSWFVDFDPVRAKMEGRDTGFPQEIADLFPDWLVDSELGQIPEGWDVSQIGNEIDAFGGSTPSTKEPSYWSEGQHCWATPKDLSRLRSPVMLDTSRKVSDAGLQRISSGILPVGTVLMSSRAPIGYLAIAEVPTAVNQGFIAMKCEKRLPNIYVLHWCVQNVGHFRNIAGGSVFPEINKKAFRRVSVLVPSEPILKAYERLSRALYGRTVVNTKQIAALAAVRDTLLPKIISGYIRVPAEERLVESVQ